MAFLKVDTDRASRKGVVFAAQVGNMVTIGRSMCSGKADAVMAIAAKSIVRGYLPEIRLLKIKKTPNTYAAESLLHSMLSKYRCKVGENYNVPVDELERIWKEV